MVKNFSDDDFRDMYPDEETAIKELFEMNHGTKPCPKCKKQTKYYKVKRRKCFECGKCGNQIYPCKGTVMENSKISVRRWLQAIHITNQEGLGLSSTKLALRLGVGYKTAWAINKQLRSVMEQLNKEKNQIKLSKRVEIDETYVGGKKKAPKEGKKTGHNGRENKLIVVGIRQAYPARIRTFYFPDNPNKKRINDLILKNVEIGTTIHTDESALYQDLNKLGYKHDTVNHSDFEWERDGVTTNRIEGTWSKFKRAYRGIYVSLSEIHIESYLAEFDFKRNTCKKIKRDRFEILKSQLFYRDNRVLDSLEGFYQFPLVLQA